MKIIDIYNILDKLSPFELQESWDNSGLVVGSFEDDIKDIFISLDIDENIENIPNNSLLITHHPLIFKPIKKVNFNNYSTILLKKLIKKDISLISMHTNFDKTHLNKYVLDLLGYKSINEKDFLLEFIVEEEFDSFIKKVKKVFDLEKVNVVKTKDFIKTATLCTGSGMGLIDFVNSDCFLTGDIKYHEAMDAKIRDLSLIDITHFGSEKFFVDILKQELKDFNIKILNSSNPFKGY